MDVIGQDTKDGSTLYLVAEKKKKTLRFGQDLSLGLLNAGQMLLLIRAKDRW